LAFAADSALFLSCSAADLRVSALLRSPAPLGGLPRAVDGGLPRLLASGVGLLLELGGGDHLAGPLQAVGSALGDDPVAEQYASQLVRRSECAVQRDARR
jgi:hypothetical protein